LSIVTMAIKRYPFIVALTLVGGLLYLADVSLTYYALHTGYFEETGLASSWALSHGSIGWFIIALFDSLFLMFVAGLALFTYHRYKTLALPMLCFASIYIFESYAVANNATWLWITRGSL